MTLQEENEYTSNIYKDAAILAGEFIVLMGMFFLLLGVLNYFNILSLQKAFPFLPQRSPSMRAQTVIASPPYHYDATAVDSTLEMFATATMQRIYLPDRLTLNPIANNAPQSITSAFFDSWQKNGYIFGIQASYQKNTVILQQLTLSGQLPASLIPSSPLTASDSAHLLNAIFLQVPLAPTFTCTQRHHPRTLYATDFCQSISESGSEKRGYGVIVYRTSPPTGQLFSCAIFNNNPSYNTYDTCINP